MCKTSFVLSLMAYALMAPIILVGQSSPLEAHRGTEAQSSFRFNAIRNPSAVAEEGKLVPGIDADCGLHRDGISGRLYTSFMDGYTHNDLDLARAYGGFWVDPGSGEFKFGSGVLPNHSDLRGTECCFNPYDSTTAVKAKFDFRPNFFQKTAELEFAGTWKEIYRKEGAKCDFVARIEFDCIPKKAWEKLADKALVATVVNDDIDWQDESFLHGLSEFLDPDRRKPAKNMEALRNELAAHLSPYQIQTPAKVPSSLLLSGLEFRYDEALNTLWSHGEVGLLAINGISVNKLTSSNSKIEYVMVPNRLNEKMASDTLRVYLEFDEWNWVFFEFFDEVVRTASSDLDGYNAVLLANPPKKVGFRFQKVDDTAKDQWLVNFINRHIWRTGRGRMN